MEIQSQLNYLEQKIKNDIAKLRRQSDLAKERALHLNLANLILGATVTVLLGLNLPNNISPTISLVIKNLALICGVLITVSSGIERFSENRSKWIRQRGTVLRLYSLQSEIEFYKAGFTDTASNSNIVVQEFFDQYQDIWRESNQEWHRVRGKPSASSLANSSIPPSLPSSLPNERVLDQGK